MIFGPCPPEDAEGCILAHQTALPNRVLKKGRRLTGQDCAEIAAAGIDGLMVARIEPGDTGEDAAPSSLPRLLQVRVLRPTPPLRGA